MLWQSVIMMLLPISNDPTISQQPRNTVTPFSHFLIPFSSDKNGGGRLNLKSQILGRKFILECTLFSKYGHFFMVLSVHWSTYARAPMLYHRILVQIWHLAKAETWNFSGRRVFRYSNTGILCGRLLRKSQMEMGLPWRWQDISNSYSRLVKVHMTANQW